MDLIDICSFSFSLVFTHYFNAPFLLNSVLFSTFGHSCKTESREKLTKLLQQHHRRLSSEPATGRNLLSSLPSSTEGENKDSFGGSSYDDQDLSQEYDFPPKYVDVGSDNVRVFSISSATSPEHIHRRLSSSSTLDLDDYANVFVPDDTNFDIEVDGLNKNFLLLSRLAGELSKAVNEDTNDKSKAYFPDTQAWLNEPDKAMIVQIHDICYVAFRATTWSMDDWAQNLNPNFSRSVCNTDDECCTTRRGFYEAYEDVDYLDSLQTALAECAKTCCVDPDDCEDDSEWCDVVLTGTSQGGAIAQVAAVYMNHYNPFIITFGQPPTMEDYCDGMNNNRLYRYVNTIVVHTLASLGDEMKFDPIPFLGDAFGSIDHSGHMIVLSDDEDNVAYYHDRQATPSVGAAQWTYKGIFDAHSIVSHIERIDTFLSNYNSPISVGGYSIGEFCVRNSQCMSPSICGKGKCSLGEVGDPCWREDDCLPQNTCEGIVSPKCEAKRNNGRGCDENDDCKSGKCRITWKGPKCRS